MVNVFFYVFYCYLSFPGYSVCAVVPTRKPPYIFVKLMNKIVKISIKYHLKITEENMKCYFVVY